VIKVHHLNASRSIRIVWLLEELGVDYEIVAYLRDPATRLAPPALRAIHPFGKSPVIEDGELVLPESGAIVDYLITRYGDGTLAPGHDDPTFPNYLQWLHAAEGSAMFPLLLDLLLGMVGGDSPLQGYARSELAKQLDAMDAELSGRDYFAGDELTGADVMMGFVLDFAASRELIGERENLRGYLKRIHARPAYKRAQRAAADAEAKV
jgi:glutathione S-transferase